MERTPHELQDALELLEAQLAEQPDNMSYEDYSSVLEWLGLARLSFNHAEFEAAEQHLDDTLRQILAVTGRLPLSEGSKLPPGKPAAGPSGVVNLPAQPVAASPRHARPPAHPRLRQA